jgi:hypothetical protein
MRGADRRRRLSNADLFAAATARANLTGASNLDAESARCIDTLVDQLLALLQVLNCDVDLIVRTKTA